MTAQSSLPIGVSRVSEPATSYEYCAATLPSYTTIRGSDQRVSMSSRLQSQVLPFVSGSFANGKGLNSVTEKYFPRNGWIHTFAEFSTTPVVPSRSSERSEDQYFCSMTVCA
jgi:hypothetical protein